MRKVLSAPAPPEDARTVITMTLSHESDEVWELRLGRGEVLRGTGAHPVYSLDREDWVRIRDLQVRERLQTAEGAVTIEALEKTRGEYRVYNLEIEERSEYLAGRSGIVAHNTCPGGGMTQRAGSIEILGKARTLAGPDFAGAVAATVASLATAWAGSPFARWDLHPQDDYSEFQSNIAVFHIL